MIIPDTNRDAGAAPASPSYLRGFGNVFATEAVPGALPQGQNSPQHTPFGLYAEQLSGTAFTAPRDHNRRSWLYRMRPSASHGPFRPYAHAGVQRPPEADQVAPNRLRWSPSPLPPVPTDFVDGLTMMAANGSAADGAGVGVYTYVANVSMRDRAFSSADGEMLLVPQAGGLRLVTEMGLLELLPGEVAVIPRGVRVRVELTGGPARGYLCENHGQLLRLPELGPIGSNGLADSRHFLTPVAACEDVERPTQLIQKFMGAMWGAEIGHSPFDVVAWHGNLAPYKYDLGRFNTLGSVSYDHPDPSIYTVLTSPSERPGVADMDFVIFPPRWMVAEHTFRPPWFHRNLMSEFMGLIHGAYDAKADGFAPGGASLHNCMSAHGPDAQTWSRAVSADLKPHKIEDTMAFMIESRRVFRPTRAALESPALQADYDECWADFPKADLGRP